MLEQNFIKSNSMGKNWCWNYFDTVENAKEPQKTTSTCKFCKRPYVGGHIARMISHLKDYKKIPPNSTK